MKRSTLYNLLAVLLLFSGLFLLQRIGTIEERGTSHPQETVKQKMDALERFQVTEKDEVGKKVTEGAESAVEVAVIDLKKTIPQKIKSSKRVSRSHYDSQFPRVVKKRKGKVSTPIIPEVVQELDTHDAREEYRRLNQALSMKIIKTGESEIYIPFDQTPSIAYR